MTVTIDDMKPRLHTLDFAREVLARTEPLSAITFTVGDAVRFTVNHYWEQGLAFKEGTDLVDAHIHLGLGEHGAQLQLTKDALLEATSICGISKSYAAKCPGPLIEAQLNYWFREGLLGRKRGGSEATTFDFQLLVAAGAGAAITRSSVVPFSNLRLLDQALDGIAARYGGGDILVDYKFNHSLRKTHLRLIVPEATRVLTGTGIDNDTWSMGIQVKNSLTGMEQTSIDGYLFRWVCTNGQLDTKATSGVWRRTGGGRDAEVYDWARAAVDDVLAGLEPALDAVQAMTDIPVEGHASDVLRDVFEHYRVPAQERTKIIDTMVDAEGEMTMYSVMAAITQTANGHEMDPAHVENLLRMGGDLPHAATSRCDACRRLMKH